MDTESRKFSEQIKKVRKTLNLSQENMAHALGVSYATVNRWENGKTKPSKLARRQFKQFYENQRIKGKLKDE